MTWPGNQTWDDDGNPEGCIYCDSKSCRGECGQIDWNEP